MALTIDDQKDHREKKGEKWMQSANLVGQMVKRRSIVEMWNCEYRFYGQMHLKKNDTLCAQKGKILSNVK